MYNADASAFIYLICGILSRLYSYEEFRILTIRRIELSKSIQNDQVKTEVAYLHIRKAIL